MSVSQREIMALYAEDLFTKRRLTVDPEGENTLVSTKFGGETIAISAYVYDRDGKVTPDKLTETHANTQRIVDTWNACLGMPSAMLKSPGSVDTLYKALVYLHTAIKAKRPVSEFDMNFIEAVIERFEPPFEGHLVSYSVPQERIDQAVTILGDLNISDDTTPMYDVAAAAVNPSHFDENPYLPAEYAMMSEAKSTQQGFTEEFLSDSKL